MRKYGSSQDQQVTETDEDRREEPQGIARTAVSRRGHSGTMGMPENVQQRLDDQERREIIDGES